MTAPTLFLRTPAKINPVLEVLSKRSDGFHELALVFQAVAIFDELELRPGGDRPSLEVETPGPPLDAGALGPHRGGGPGTPPACTSAGGLGAGQDNLVLKAANLFGKEILGRPAGVGILLRKRIPMEAGLGGGSSDAAAALMGLDRLFSTGLGREGLLPLAARLGSDVPYFLQGGSALGRGRGEILTPWEGGAGYHLVLVKPREGLSTPKVFGSGKAVWTDGRKAEGFRGILASGNAASFAGGLFNGLEPAAAFLMPGILGLKEGLLKAGALGASVSGSGPTLFGVARDEVHARGIAEKMREEDRTVLVTRTIPTGVEFI